MQNFDYYEKVCFVIMPFSKKKVIIYNEIKNIQEELVIDFDDIYNEIFKPAISEVELPEGGCLIPKRVDDSFFSSIIDADMFKLIEYSRIAFVDITGLNPNVVYELGVRHRARSSGTVVFRLSRIAPTTIPFDISRVRNFSYDYDPISKAEESKEIIKNVLKNTLKHNKVDSPVQMVLSKQKSNEILNSILIEAENSVRTRDLEKAVTLYRTALSEDRNNFLIMMKLGLLYKDMGEWHKALNYFTKVCKIYPQFSEAYKEKGIAENKLKDKNIDSEETGKKSLIRAIEINNEDFDAFSSLGGIYKREKNYKKAYQMYKKAAELSRGNSYPLLNKIKLKAKITGRFELSDREKYFVEKAKTDLTIQIKNVPPYNAPWSFFDLAEINLFEKNRSKFLKNIKSGSNFSTAKWQIETFYKSLVLLKGVKNLSAELLQEGLIFLEEVIDYWQESKIEKAIKDINKEESLTSAEKLALEDNIYDVASNGPNAVNAAYNIKRFFKKIGNSKLFNLLIKVFIQCSPWIVSEIFKG